MDIRETAALVTGGSSGLGAAAARALAAAGCTVVIADIDEAKGSALAAEINGAFVRTDVVVGEDVAAAVATADSVGHPLRVAVACAGIGPGERTLRRNGRPHDEELYRRVTDVNQVGTFHLLCHAAAGIALQDPVVDQERGVIVVTSSTAATDGPAGMLAYSASKSAVAGMVLPAARDLARYGIRVCSVLPGTFDTPLLAGATPQRRQQLTGDVLFPRRMGRPEEFGALVRMLAEISYFNAAAIRLDGGLRLAGDR